MKILWLTNTACSASEKLKPGYNRGGWLSALEQELSKNSDIELHVAFYHYADMDSFKYIDSYYHPIKRAEEASKVRKFFKRFFKRNLSDDQKEIDKVNSIINIVKPDLIHVHGTEDNFGLIQERIKIPVVISIQGILSPLLEKYYSGIPSSIAKRYESLFNKVVQKSFSYAHHFIKVRSEREKIILLNTNNVIGRTEWDKRVTRILSPNSTYFMGHEILRNGFYSKIWSKIKFNTKIKIVTISSQNLFKGYETIIKTAALLSQVSFDFEWLVIGLDKKSTLVNITNKWLHVNPEKVNVHLIGEKGENEIIDFLLDADLYCQVSHIENSPNSLCEAMLIGMPIVASFAGGTSSLCENNKQGILVQDGDPYSLSGAIKEMCSDFNKASQLALAARQMALKRHNKKKIVEDMFSIYESIIEKNSV